MKKTTLFSILLFLFLFLTNLAYSQCWQSVALSKSINRSLWAIRKDGTLWMGGYTSVNEKWNLDAAGTRTTTGTAQFFPFPTQVGNANNWAKISASTYGSFYAIKNDGTLWAWGNNGNSELGLGNVNQYVSIPTQIGNDTDWKEISAGTKCVFAIKQDGSLWGWGLNYGYQLGDGTTINKNVPTRVGNNNMGNTWTSITCSERGSMAICTNGAPWGWGETSAFGSPTSVGPTMRIPTRLGNFNDWKLASNSPMHSLLISVDNMLFGLGRPKECKELTKDNVGNFTTPVPIGPIGIESSWNADWKSVVATTFSSYAIKLDGSLWRWGWNGIGSPCSATNFNPSPVQIPLINVNMFVASGSLLQGGYINSYAAIHDNGKLSIWGNDFTDITQQYLTVPKQIGIQGCPCLCSTEDRFAGIIKILSQGRIIDSIACNKPLAKKLSCGVNYSFFAPAFTDNSVCAAKDSLIVRSSTGVVVRPAPKANINDPFIVSFSQPGIYNLVYLITRGGKICKECSITLTVECVRRITNEAIKTDAKKMIEIKQ